MASVADALLQDEEESKYWQNILIKPIQLHLKTQQEKMEQKSNATKVDFFTLAREAGGESS
jgi:alpha-D-ribose 1-methylphosphonate 5-triphosphate synthase subunit PhnG